MNITASEGGPRHRPASHGWILAALPAVLFLLAGCTTPAPDEPATVAEVQPRHETASIDTGGNIADATVWISDGDPGDTLVVATDNAAGVYVYAPDGTTLDSRPLGAFNSIDLLGLDGSRLLVGATSSERGRMAVLSVDASNGAIDSALVASKALDFEPSAFCATRLIGGTSTAFVGSAAGDLVRFSISVPRFGDNVAIRQFARLDLGAGITDCVADHTREAVWVAQQRVGIRQLRLRMTGDTRPDRIARIDGQRLVSEVGGLTIARVGRQSLLLASVPADNSFAAFGLGSGAIQGGISTLAGSTRFHGRFRIVAGNGIDAVTGTQGIAAAGASGIGGLPGGVLIVHDAADDEPGGGQNFKFIALGDLDEAL